MKIPKNKVEKTMKLPKDETGSTVKKSHPTKKNVHAMPPDHAHSAGKKHRGKK